MEVSGFSRGRHPKRQRRNQRRNGHNPRFRGPFESVAILIKHPQPQTLGLLAQLDHHETKSEGKAQARIGN
jgi:hypothetical protein